ncbi:hypothetical protein CHUAL_008313 [Chamberlinius hualienensis]
MGISGYKNAFCAAICILSAISTVSSQCCNHQPETCEWQGQWHSASEGSPNLSLYPTFVSTQPSSLYIFVQDLSGTVTSATTFHITTSNTVISFDYFFDAPTADPYDYMQAYFVNTATQFTVLLSSMSVQSGSWRHNEVACNSRNYFCCGSSSLIPCQGLIKFASFVDNNKRQALFAVDNVGICGAVSTSTTKTTTPATPTTTTFPTLPPPNPSDCCRFDSDICGSTLTSWYWSAQTPPYLLVPDYSGNFLWADTVGAQVKTSVFNNVTPETEFSLTYYISTTGVLLYLNFLPNGQSTKVLAIVGTIGNQWSTIAFQCGTCCGGGSCDGELFIQIYSETPYFTVAIDNADIDSSCHSSFPCCYFDDTYLCGYVSGNDDGYNWRLSNVPSYRRPPSPGSPYVYFEIQNYQAAKDLNVILRSPNIIIDSKTVFTGNIYVQIDLVSTTVSTLKINFYNDDMAVDIPLKAISDTVGLWRTFDFDCEEANCCQGQLSCNGHLEIQAYVQALGAYVLYGVDAFEISNTCDLFPGTEAVKAIKFQPS